MVVSKLSLHLRWCSKPDASTAYSAPFRGISKQSCGQVNLSQSDFTPIAPQQTLDYEVDVADLYDLDVGAYNVSVEEYIPYAQEGSTELTGRSLHLLSDPLLLAVDTKKPTAERTELKTRNTLQNDCSSAQFTTVSNANKACARMATAAAEAASSGSDSAFQEFFMDNSQSTRSQVAAKFRKVAAECSSTPGGTGSSFCTDQKRECGGGLLAYTYWQDQGRDEHFGSTYYCPIYFETLRASDAGCNDQSQASNTLHETTHAVLATHDIAYGPENVRRLSGSQALQNADSYTYYAIGELLAGFSFDGILVCFC
jgi:deuterolysin